MSGYTEDDALGVGGYKGKETCEREGEERRK